MKYNPIKKILILVTILAVPGFLYYLLQEKGKNRYKPLAIYGPKKVASTFHTVRGKQIPDTVYHVVEDFKLVNQKADTLTWENYKGKIVLLNLFYTNGPGGINFANKAMSTFANVYEKNTMIHFIGLSIDPEHDKPAILGEYAKNISANAGKWDLLTGDSIQVNKLIKNGLLLDALKVIENGKAKFTFSNMFVLLDSQHRIRGYYEATNQEALSKLDDEVKVLVAEELRNIKDGR
ncbi:SCO family protein [Pedobacter frigiditerrae]|uniref:SCO family protein n=1 Tax=Pedobacter frigiditerrae TaxID=2530452 RepID=A0A4R0N0W3_9SPHI|nr:SCO family protein [Pedobacter frigiditerrae]TCC93310.1 SCO family protein [Pedobacter frigiditerrae]